MPLSAYARSPRPLQLRTVKENKDAATLLAVKYRKEQRAVTLASPRGCLRLPSVISVSEVPPWRGPTARQIEAARRAISRHVKRGGRIWIRVFPDKPNLYQAR